MEKHKERLLPEAVVLDKYLNSYNRCKNRKRALERRKYNLEQEFYSPLHSPVIDGMPKGSGGQNVGCAGLSYELDEINTRIDEKIQELRKEYVKITDILEFLNDGSTERAILEYKYIDGLSWKGICDQEHLSKTPATQYWRKGLYLLLEFAKVQELVREYEKEIDGVLHT